MHTGASFVDVVAFRRQDVVTPNCDFPDPTNPQLAQHSDNRTPSSQPAHTLLASLKRSAYPWGPKKLLSGGAMEAASARMAARERYGAFGEAAPSSQLQRFIRTIDRNSGARTTSNMLSNSASMRSAEFRTQPCHESRDHRLD